MSSTSTAVLPRDAGRAEPPAETAPAVLTAVCAGIAPLPFLAVYAVLFIAHALHPVGPPDVTNTRTGELIVGVIAAVAFVLVAASVLSYLNHARRWPFLLLQAGALATAVLFLGHGSTGGPVISAVLAGTSALAIVLGLLPVSAAHVDSPVGRRARAGDQPPTDAPT
jgi:hypothetical protein